MIGLPEIPRYKVKAFLSKHVTNKENVFKNKDISIAIIIPCFKHAVYLKKCFESIINQTQRPNEVILVNDHSPDNTQEITNDLQQKYGEQLNIKVINNSENFGQAKSINTACNNAESTYLMILNDDDYLYPDAIKTTLDLLEQRKELAMIGSTATCISEDKDIDDIIKKQEVYISGITIHHPDRVRTYKNFNDLNMTHSSSTFNKIAWQEVGGYYSNKKERVVPFSDRDFQLRVGLIYQVGVILGKPLAFWRTNSSVDSRLNS